MKRAISLGLATFLTLGCSSKSEVSSFDLPNISWSEGQERKIDYSYLEYLCDKPIENRKLFIDLYIEDNERLFDIQNNRKIISDYVYSAFAKHSIHCQFSYSKLPLNKKDKPNELGIEIYYSRNSVANRYLELYPSEDESSLGRLVASGAIAFSSTENRIILFRNDWQNFRYFERDEMEKSLSTKIGESNLGELTLINMSRVLSHEIGHTLGLPHLELISPNLFRSDSNLPNIMCERVISGPSTRENVFGSDFNDLQVRLMHSFLAEGNMWTEFNKNKKHIYFFWKNFATKSNMEFNLHAIDELVDTLKSMN